MRSPCGALAGVALLALTIGSPAVAQSFLPFAAPVPPAAVPSASAPTASVPQPKARPAAPGLAPGKPVEAARKKSVAEVTGTTAAPAAAAPGPKMPAPKPGTTTAVEGNQRALVDKVNAYLTGLNSLVGNFVQVGPDGRRTEGRFYLQKPGRVRFEYDPPSPIELISDGSSVVVRDRKLATQDVYPLSQTPLRFLVADRIDLMKDTNVVGVNADDTFVTVVVEERQVLGGTHRLMLMFGARDFQLRQWTITDPQGYDTTVALYNLDPKQKPDPGLFKIDYTRYLQ
jgi:outer membrane lipoprotein-sorting protein